VGRQNADLVSRNAQLSLEMEALAGTSTAAMAPALAEARAALAAAQARCAELAAQNSVLADQAQAAQSGEAALMQARLALISQGFESIHTARGPPSESGLTDDTASEAGFSDLASNVSEAPGLSDATRAANRARAAQNKAKFDAIKAERNAFKAEAKKAARELDRMRLEVTKVQELKSQLKALQETLYV
jgi:enamine deaminase RidA (YjgF/YER057c/UK114 family)